MRSRRHDVPVTLSEKHGVGELAYIVECMYKNVFDKEVHAVQTATDAITAHSAYSYMRRECADNVVITGPDGKRLTSRQLLDLAIAQTKSKENARRP